MNQKTREQRRDEVKEIVQETMQKPDSAFDLSSIKKPLSPKSASASTTPLSLEEREALHVLDGQQVVFGGEILTTVDLAAASWYKSQKGSVGISLTSNGSRFPRPICVLSLGGQDYEMRARIDVNLVPLKQ